MCRKCVDLVDKGTDWPVGDPKGISACGVCRMSTEILCADVVQSECGENKTEIRKSSMKLTI